MKPTEEALRPEDVAALEKNARNMLIDAHALSGLIASGCRDPFLFLPLAAKQLKAIHLGAGEFRVVAADEKGEIRQGPRGPLDGSDVARELKQEPGFFEIGWRPRNTPTSGKR